MWESFLKGNEIQIAWVPNNLSEYITKQNNSPTLKKELSEKYSFTFIPEFGFVYLELNLKHPAIAIDKNPEVNRRNKLLRCAIRNAYNWALRNEKIYSGIGTPFPGVIPPFLQSYDKKISSDSIIRDVNSASRMLQRYRAFQDFPVIEYSDTLSLGAKQDFALFRSWLTKAGYPKDKVVFKGFTNFADFWQAKQEGKLMISSVAWSLDYPDAENIFQLFYSKNIGTSNSSAYQSLEFDHIFEQSQTSINLNERIKLYQKLNTLLIEDCALISGLVRNRAYLWHKNITLYPNKEFMGNFLKYIDIF